MNVIVKKSMGRNEKIVVHETAGKKRGDQRMKSPHWGNHDHTSNVQEDINVISEEGAEGAERNQKESQVIQQRAQRSRIAQI